MFWKYCQKLPCKNPKVKRLVFIGINSSLLSVVGLVLWLIVKSMVPEINSIQWLICFVGYPMAIGYLLSILYMFNHE